MFRSIVEDVTTEPSHQSYAAGLAALLSAQDGVVSRAQLVGAAHEPYDLERLLRRKELFVALPGVYVNHNGPRTWQQRAWVAVLSCWPAALAGASAFRAENGPGMRGFDEAAPIEVAVDVGRTVRGKPDVRVRRMAGMAASLKARHRFPRRRWLGGILADVAAGTASVLEYGYLDRVERAHSLPVADRQQPDRVAGGRICRDAPYAAYGLVIELDGRLDHTAVALRDRDLERDLETATTDRRTVRLGWGQVYDRPCRTAAQVGRLLRLGGWEGSPTPCSPTPCSPTPCSPTPCSPTPCSPTCTVEDDS